jgi:hypothetical protein
VPYYRAGESGSPLHGEIARKAGVQLANRPLEPAVGADQVPASEEQERAADGQQRVVEHVPVETAVQGDSRIREQRKEDERDEPDPEDGEPVDPHVVTAQVPAPRSKRSPAGAEG